jgi:hypothetical protein
MSMTHSVQKSHGTPSGSQEAPMIFLDALAVGVCIENPSPRRKYFQIVNRQSSRLPGGRIADKVRA